MDLETRIREMVKAKELTFKGARQRYHLPAGDAGKLHLLGAEYAAETGEPRAASITKACTIYWRIYGEKK